MFYVETIDGVVIEAVSSVETAKKFAKVGSTVFRVRPARVYHVVAGMKVYV